MKRGTWRRSLAAVPGVGISLLPKITCPACWPAYAGLLSSIGLGFLVPNTRYLLPLTILFLVVVVLTLVLHARKRRGYGPFVLGCTSSLFIVLGKFLLSSNPVFYAGLGILILASVWNGWPVVTCRVCAPVAGRLDNLQHVRRNGNGG